MSTADRFHMSGKAVPPKPPLTYRQVLRSKPLAERISDKAVEARKGGAKLRRKIWEDHKYDCTSVRRWAGRDSRTKKKYLSMEPCSLFANYAHLWGETPDPPLSKWDQGRFAYSITDGHW